MAIVILALMALPMVSACAPEAAPPPDERMVTFLALSDYTGPIAGLMVPAQAGCEDYVKYLNESGGVDGVKINLITIDTRYHTGRGISAYKKYRTEPNLFVMSSCSTPITKAIAPLTERDKVVQTTPADGEFQAHIGWVFPWGVTYQNGFGAVVDWIAEDWKANGNAGMPTVGYMDIDTASGREPLRGGKEYAEQVGINLLQPEFFPIGELDHSAYLSRVAQAGADYCFIGVLDPLCTNVLRDALKLGLTDTIQFVCGFWGPTEAIGVQLHPEATEGTVISTFFRRGNEASAHPLAQKLAEKYRGEKVSEWGSIYLVGVGWTLIFEEALKKAIADVGYDNLDGEAMLHAYESLTGLDVTQGIQGPCAYSPTSRQGSNTVRFYQVEKGKLVPTSDWREAPDCVSLHDWSQ